MHRIYNHSLDAGCWLCQTIYIYALTLCAASKVINICVLWYTRMFAFIVRSLSLVYMFVLCFFPCCCCCFSNLSLNDSLSWRTDKVFAWDVFDMKWSTVCIPMFTKPNADRYFPKRKLVLTALFWVDFSGCVVYYDAGYMLISLTLISNTFHRSSFGTRFSLWIFFSVRKKFALLVHRFLPDSCFHPLLTSHFFPCFLHSQMEEKFRFRLFSHSPPVNVCLSVLLLLEVVCFCLLLFQR